MLEGSCLCGAVHYQINGELGAAMMCHCQKCRKSNGSAYAINAAVNTADFHLLSGVDVMRYHASSADARRYFCGQCGTPIYSQRQSAPELLRLRIGSLDSEVEIDKQCHIFVGSKACWDDITDDLPQYDERP
ncbi:GFA family protein [Oceanobacter mangrovi]|uniref:GFA family protein n=1 Tax=Oceanobacter mangrovi TaxID=2862510 RepID=UPI001C8E7578|nr:GFA family protein [Oceanobacter mangrovi]